MMYKEEDMSVKLSGGVTAQSVAELQETPKTSFGERMSKL